MRNPWTHCLSLTILLVISGCERSVDYISHVEIVTTEKTLNCPSDGCPDVELELIIIDEPTELSQAVNDWTKVVLYDIMGIKSNEKHISIKEAIASYVNTSQIAYPETSELSTAHELLVETAISYQSNHLLSMVLRGFQFSGGAHGYDYHIYGNFNPKTGQEVALSQLLKTDFYAFAKAQLSQKYPNQTITEKPENYLQIGFTEEGMAVIYNDVGLEGIPSENKHLSIPWEIAEDYLAI